MIVDVILAPSTCTGNFLNLLLETSSDFCLNHRALRGIVVKIYNVIDYLIILLYMLACMYFAPAHLGPRSGLLIREVYFIFCWFLAGLYLADILHLGTTLGFQVIEAPAA